MKLDDIEEWLRSSGLEIVLIVLGAVLIARATRWASERYSRRYDRLVDDDDGVGATERQKQTRAVVQATEWLLIGVVYFAALLLVIPRLGIPLDGIVAPAAVLGVALGFGAQRVVQDLLAGFFLLTEHSFGFGDVVRISAVGTDVGTQGTVEELTLRTTKLRTIEGELVIVPNGQIGQVTNLSRAWARVIIDVPVSVDAKLEDAIGVLTEVADTMADEETWSSLLLDAPDVWGVESIKVGYVLVRMTTRTVPEKQGEVGRELRKRAAEALSAADMNPQQEIALPTHAKFSGA